MLYGNLFSVIINLLSSCSNIFLRMTSPGVVLFAFNLRRYTEYRWETAFVRGNADAGGLSLYCNKSSNVNVLLILTANISNIIVV